MTQKELIEHLREEVKRVKIQRNDYEQRWLKSLRELDDIRRSSPLSQKERMILIEVDKLFKLIQK